MIAHAVLFVGLVNLVCVLGRLPTNLDCPADGSEITIDDIGMTSRRFRFPQLGTNAFPQNFECKWKFRSQSGLRILIQVRDATTGANDDIELFDTDGVTSLLTENGPLSDRDAVIVASSGDTVTVRLTTDGNTAATEEFFVNVIAGRDAGVCPSTGTTIPALDSAQFLTSNNFPDRYENNEECDLVISADEGKVVNYTYEFTNMEEYVPSRRRVNCYDTIEMYNGLTTDDALFDSCDPFFPQITGVSEGRILRIRYKTGSFIQYRGFLMRYLQQDVDECAMTPGPCHNNAFCVNSDGSFQCICKTEFPGNGFECQEIPVQPLGKYLLPVLASSVGTGLSGAVLLALLFAANSSRPPTIWTP
uniref:Cubilin n=1 Tax=Crassostrea virginica TaxID=6565 RepID=A0A8B8EBS3_CRAVI|nr:cubilin-like [Crassostrea virginica]